MKSGKWPRFAVMGAGSVGCYFGGMLARAGAPVTLIGRPKHVDAINAAGLRMKTLAFDETVPVAASTEVGDAAGADLVLVAVKTVDTEEAARSLLPHLRPDAVVLSLQNGVDNVERMRRAAPGLDPVAAVVYVAVAMTGPGALLHSGRGDLVIGNIPGGAGPKRDLSALPPVFARAGIGCVVSDDIRTELWRKLVLNAAYNAVSALTRKPYGAIVADPVGCALITGAALETVAVANALGIGLDAEEMVGAALALGRSAMPEATSSTAQDIALGRRTEIDSLNGLVAARGERLGVGVALNRTLRDLVKLLEQSISPPPDPARARPRE